MPRILLVCILFGATQLHGDVAPINPFPRAIIDEEVVKEWQFSPAREGWQLDKDLEARRE